jgi:hypothetical protein
MKKLTLILLINYSLMGEEVNKLYLQINKATNFDMYITGNYFTNL